VVLTGTGTTVNKVQGNVIGTDLTGTLSLGNALDGLDLVNGAASNTVGGTGAGTGNTIAFNGGVGVVVGSSATDSTTTGNGILGNAIYANAALGIDLGADGPTPNHAMNPDVGPNNRQNYPVLTSVTVSGGTTTITGTLHSAASKTNRIEFFSNTTADPSGYGQGQTYLGFTTVTTNSSGDASFTAVLSLTLSSGLSVAATATDPGNNTSEFSLNVVVPGATSPSEPAIGMNALAMPSSPAVAPESISPLPVHLDAFFLSVGQTAPAASQFMPSQSGTSGNGHSIEGQDGNVAGDPELDGLTEQ
jgi:hypothetical protein